METVGVGIIGAGGIAAAHAKAYQMLGARVHLIGVADIDERALRAATKSLSGAARTTICSSETTSKW